jgi:hypothetical protein
MATSARSLARQGRVWRKAAVRFVGYSITRYAKDAVSKSGCLKNAWLPKG